MIQVKNLSYSYAQTDALRDISFDVQPGECMGVLGNNGAGKSTLVTCIGNIRTPKSGAVYIDGRDIFSMKRLESARCISYVAQKNEISRMTVFDAVLLGRRPYIKWGMSDQDLSLCDDAIAQVGLSAFRLRYVDELSGGELQKVMLARALVQQPKLLLLDEPTSCLDPKGQYEMLALVREVVRERQISALMVLHDLSLALRYCDRFLFIREGAVFRQGDASVITEDTIFAVYGVASTVAQMNGRKVVVIE